MVIPTASDKVILVDFSLTETNAFSLQPIDTKRQFSSTDKGTAFIGFKSENIANGMIADISLANLDDDSRVNRTFTVTTGTNFDATNKIFYYQIPDDEIVHWGNWIGYGKFTDGATSKTWTGTKLKYSISSDITNDPTTKLIVMEDVNAFMDAMNILKVDLEADHAQSVSDSSRAGTDHTTALADHAIVGGYNTRLQAEETATANNKISAIKDKTFADVNARLEDVETDTTMMVTNIVTNGDFSGGWTGWNYITAIVDGRASKLATGAWQSIACAVNTVIGNQYYVAAEIEGTSANYIELSTTGRKYAQSASKSRVSIVAKATLAKHNLLIGESRLSGWTTYYVDNVMAIDLTATFGAGNEPTVEQMDRLLTQFPNSWFDGTENLFLAKWALNELRRLENEKANKTQEAWITPTLLNGWVSFGAPEDIPSYYKDEFGNVKMRGVLKSGTLSVSMFTLPIGYRPLKNKYFSIISNNVPAFVLINPSGGVNPLVGTSNVFVSLDNITFRAEG